ncbi:MAG: hypothetical protein WCJ56_05300 [bacterium]
MTTASTTTKVITFVVVGALWTSLLYAAHSQPQVKKGNKQPNTPVVRSTNTGIQSSATVGTAVITEPLASTTVVGPITDNHEKTIEPYIIPNDFSVILKGPTPPTVDPIAVAISPTDSHPIDQGVVWEAETAQGIKQQRLAFEISKKILPIDEDGAGGVSGEKWLKVARKENDQEKIIPDTARYYINIPAAGTYYLWARTYWDSGCGNSFFVHIDGVNKSSDDTFVLGGDATYNGLHWVCLLEGKNMKPLQLKAGLVNLNLLVREAGTNVDQLLLTRDYKFVPTDVQ